MRFEIPTTLSKETNAQFRVLYKKYFDEEINIEQANEEAYRLLSFFAILIEKNPKYQKPLE